MLSMFLDDTEVEDNVLLSCPDLKLSAHSSLHFHSAEDDVEFSPSL